jgi:hypothetical protein
LLRVDSPVVWCIAVQWLSGRNLCLVQDRIRVRSEAYLRTPGVAVLGMDCRHDRGIIIGLL